MTKERYVPKYILIMGKWVVYDSLTDSYPHKHVNGIGWYTHEDQAKRACFWLKMKGKLRSCLRRQP